MLPLLLLRPQLLRLLRLPPNLPFHRQEPLLQEVQLTLMQPQEQEATTMDQLTLPILQALLPLALQLVERVQPQVLREIL